MRNDIEYFATPNDVVTRLNNGYIRYKGKFWYVIGAYGFSIILHELTAEKPKEFTIDLNKEIHNIELSRPKIGFFNLATNAYWATVHPARQYTQVLMNRMVSLECITQGVNKTSLNQWRMDAYVDNLNGKYPEAREIEAKLTRGDISSAAFSRNFALSQFNKKNGERVRVLFHRNQVIGHYDFNASIYHIQPSFDTPLLTNILTKNGINYVVD